MDITPQVSPDAPLVQRYGQGSFTIGGTDYRGSVLIGSAGVEMWTASRSEEIEATVPHILAHRGDAELLLIGSGPGQILLPRSVREKFRTEGLSVDAMDTGAACRTFNVLLGEGRRVMAALLPV